MSETEQTEQQQVAEQATSNQPEDPTVCLVCNKKFGLRSTMLGHMRKRHGLDTGHMLKRGVTCNHPDCMQSGKRFSSTNQYRQHLHDVHSVEEILLEHKFAFRNLSEFMEWKQMQEKKDVAQYVAMRGVALRSGLVVYSCSRSGYYESKSSGKRQGKSQGSKKCGCNCPACIVLKLKDNTFIATYYPTHYGHTKDVRHLNLTQEEKLNIADDLLSGLPPSEIISRYRASGDNTTADRFQMVTRKDIHNVKVSYKAFSSLFASQSANKGEKKTPRAPRKPKVPKNQAASQLTVQQQQHPVNPPSRQSEGIPVTNQSFTQSMYQTIGQQPPVHQSINHSINQLTAHSSYSHPMEQPMHHSLHALGYQSAFNPSLNPVINPLAHQSIIDQAFYQTIGQTIDHSAYHSTLYPSANQSLGQYSNEPINHSMNQPIDHSMNQASNHQSSIYQPVSPVNQPNEHSMNRASEFHSNQLQPIHHHHDSDSMEQHSHVEHSMSSSAAGMDVDSGSTPPAVPAAAAAQSAIAAAAAATLASQRAEKPLSKALSALQKLYNKRKAGKRSLVSCHIQKLLSDIGSLVGNVDDDDSFGPTVVAMLTSMKRLLMNKRRRVLERPATPPSPEPVVPPEPSKSKDNNNKDKVPIPRKGPIIIVMPKKRKIGPMITIKSSESPMDLLERLKEGGKKKKRGRPRKTTFMTLKALHAAGTSTQTVAPVVPVVKKVSVGTNTPLEPIGRGKPARGRGRGGKYSSRGGKRGSRGSYVSKGGSSKASASGSTRGLSTRGRRGRKSVMSSARYTGLVPPPLINVSAATAAAMMRKANSSAATATYNSGDETETEMQEDETEMQEDDTKMQEDEMKIQKDVENESTENVENPCPPSPPALTLVPPPLSPSSEDITPTTCTVDTSSICSASESLCSAPMCTPNPSISYSHQ